MTKCVVSISLLAVAALAQDNPLTAELKTMYGMGKTNIIKAAEKMPESDYAFQPTAEVRTFGQLVGHVANAQYMFCGTVDPSVRPAERKDWEQVVSKAELVQGLKDAVAACDKVYSALTDSAGAAKVKMMGRDLTKLGVLSFNNMHNYEHYGNMVTYMRIKGIVPPSSENAPAKPAAKKSGD